MEDKIIIEQYYNLKSCRAVADLYGCSDETIRRVLLRNNIKLTGWKRPPKEANPKKPRTFKKEYTHVSYEKYCECCGGYFIAHDIRKRYCSKRCSDIDYRRSKGQDSRLEPYSRKCEICGKEFETFNHSKKTCSDECSQGLKKQRDKRKSKPAIKMECVICGKPFHTKQPQQKTCGDERCKYYYRLMQHRIRNHKYQESKPVKMITYELRECKECGELFSVDSRLTNVYCSDECRRKHYNIARDHRIPKAQRIDKISLKRLYKRDKGICYLCGGVCDWNDWKVSEKGNPYPGDNYPTRDHVIPVSRGGLDSWENVRLAHWKCNLDKSADIIDVIPIPKDFAIPVVIDNRKKTAQYTLNGELVKIWESTAQIKRELGLNDKHIQSVCRRCKSKTGNAYGYHWEYIDKNVEHEDIKLKESEAV